MYMIWGCSHPQRLPQSSLGVQPPPETATVQSSLGVQPPPETATLSMQPPSPTLPWLKVFRPTSALREVAFGRHLASGPLAMARPWIHVDHPRQTAAMEDGWPDGARFQPWSKGWLQVPPYPLPLPPPSPCPLAPMCGCLLAPVCYKTKGRSMCEPKHLVF